MITNIQALRAFAALNVVFLHIITTGASYGQKATYFHFLDGWGQNGVDIFFVISGFVMVYTQSVNPKSPKVFIRHRIVKIVPIYWILTSAWAVFFLIVPSIFRSFEFSFAKLFSSYLFISELIVQDNPILGVGWTLEYEMLFYSLFAIGLLSPNSFLSRAIPIVLLLILATLGYSDWIVLEFVFGMFCALFFIKHPRISSPIVVFSLGIFLLYLGIFFKPDIHRTLIAGIPSVLLVISICYLPQTKNALWKLLGDASYSIYLTHIFVVPPFYKISSKIFASLPGDFLAVFCLILSSIVGILVYLLIEKPSSKLTKRLIPRRVD